MKKIYILIISIFFISNKLSSQIIYDFKNSIDASRTANKSIQFNYWIKSSEIIDEIPYFSYIHFFNKNTIGTKKAIDLVKLICKNNDLDFDNPNVDDSYLASYVESILDFEKLYLSIETGGSIIEKVWYKFTKSKKACIMRLSLSEESYSVSIVNPKSQ